MTTTLPDPRADGEHSLAPLPPGSPGSLLEPGRRLSPDPRDDRPWRIALTVLGAAFLVVLLLFLAAITATSWITGRSYSEVPATVHLGAPDSLALTSEIGNVRVLHSADVDQVTVALVENEATTPPPAGTEVRARVEQQGSAQARVVDVDQPDGYGPVPWQHDAYDVLVLVPEGHELALELTSSVGNIRADGEFSALDITAHVGDVQLAPVAAPEGLRVSSDLGHIEMELVGTPPAAIDVTSSVGDIDLLLPSDAGGDVHVASDLGSIGVSAPGSGRWNVDATSELGGLNVDPSLTGASGPALGTLTVTSEVGDVAITR
ncbi:DUF4097 family beta strand repeat-containing protein [Brachybacterium sp. FME24]|uniref:DUF4097 family beta strand repeat-containing protein n=1 Tax=Brachybacterium sp. FME24 TaxID=2742605 RepID=UPI0018687491|nr:DUF4097 family beta strand repeat-containing protein [Brachybacterium sp. FME24]